MTATIRDIQCAVAARYDVSVDLMLSEHRPRWITEPRQVAMYLSLVVCGATITSVARRFQRDRTCVRNARARVEQRIATDADFAIRIEAIAAALRTRRGITTQTRDDIVDALRTPESMARIADRFGFSVHSVRRIAAANGFTAIGRVG